MNNATDGSKLAVFYNDYHQRPPKIISEGGFESVGDKVSIVVKQPNCLASTIEECPLPGFIVWG
jgi:hypothetical protein